MAKGLFLCRAFYLGGCHVVAADYDSRMNVSSGRFSKAVRKHYYISSPEKVGQDKFSADMIEIIRRERIDLLVTCSGVATAVEDARMVTSVEKAANCRAFQLRENVVRVLDDKLMFMKQTDDLGLASPKWHCLKSRGDVPFVLKNLTKEVERGSSIKYIIKSAGMDDVSRGAMPLLDPLRQKEAVSILSGLDYSNGKTWILQEYFSGTAEYCTHAVVVNGIVKAFTACPSASVLMHYELLDPDSWIYADMRAFTETYAAALQKMHGKVTGHLSFDFLLREQLTSGGLVLKPAPIECNPRCHTATIIFRGREAELTAAYLSSLDDGRLGLKRLEVRRDETSRFYWMAHDLIALLALPVLQIQSLRDINQVVIQQLNCIAHFMTWKDPTFEWWDPLPWFILNHIYWPLNLLRASFAGTKWKQLNVSTGKMFQC